MLLFSSKIGNKHRKVAFTEQWFCFSAMGHENHLVSGVPSPPAPAPAVVVLLSLYHSKVSLGPTRRFSFTSHWGSFCFPLALGFCTRKEVLRMAHALLCKVPKGQEVLYEYIPLGPVSGTRLHAETAVYLPLQQPDQAGL